MYLILCKMYKRENHSEKRLWKNHSKFMLRREKYPIQKLFQKRIQTVKSKIDHSKCYRINHSKLWDRSFKMWSFKTL